MKTPFRSFSNVSGPVRSKPTSAGFFALCGALGLLAGCASAPSSHVVSAPPPPPPTTVATTTTTTTTPVAIVTNPNYAAPAVSTTVVTQAPPMMQQEVVLAQPSPQHVWVPGYWTWRNERYEWMAGQWQLPPGSSVTWVNPRWERQGNAYRFYDGYWN